MEERSSEGQGGSGFGRWLLLAAAIVGLLYFAWPYITGKGKGPDRQPLTQEDWGTVPDDPRPDEATCELKGARSVMTVSTRGGAIKSAQMTDAKYAVKVDKPARGSIS